jgi:DNA modification methylase
MIEHMRTAMQKEIVSTVKETNDYIRDVVKTPRYELHMSDCVELARDIESGSIDYTVFSPPFSSLYTYSNSERDMGNSKSDDEFFHHFKFLVDEIFRITRDGRLVSFHCMNLPTSKQNDGFIGIKDFRGDLIRMFQDAGFIFHSEVVIWKDPVTAMQRTKALGLLHKTIRKDSSMSRQGIPDYLVTMRKPGDNDKPIAHTHDEFPVQLWQKYASPVWMDINPSDTLQFRTARENDDERHICPLQLQVIERAINLWSAKDDLVFSPFTGIGSEGFVALNMGRKFIGSELKKSYFELAKRNLSDAVNLEQSSLFDL